VLGSFVGRYLGGLVTEIRSWEAAFLVLGVLTLTLAVVLWRGLPRSRRFRPSAGVGAALRGLPAGLRNRRLLATCAVGFGTLFGQVATFTYISFHLAAAPYHLNTRQLGEVVAVFLVGMLINPLLGRLALRHGELRLLQFGLLLGLAGILLTLTSPLPTILLGLGMLAASTFVSQSMSISIVPKLAPELRSAAVGLYVSAYYLGGTAGALLPGLLWSRLGWPGTVALVALAQLVVAIIATQAWRDLATPRRDPDPRPPPEEPAAG
jgi:Arabinose efflux permease